MDAWPYFPGSKVGQMFLYSSLDDYLLVMLITNRYTVRCTIIPELGV